MYSFNIAMSLFVLIRMSSSERERSVFMEANTVYFRVYQHKTVALQCYYANITNPLPLVIWTHRGHVISKGVMRDDNYSDSITYISLSNSTYARRFVLVQTTRLSQLSIYNVQLRDIGEYKCYVENETPLSTTLRMRVNRRYATTRNIMKTQRRDQSTSSKEIWTTLPYSVGIIPTVITYDRKKIMREKILILCCVCITIGSVITSIISIIYYRYYVVEEMKGNFLMKFQHLLNNRCKPIRRRTISAKTMSTIENNFTYLQPSTLISPNHYDKCSQIL